MTTATLSDCESGALFLHRCLDVQQITSVVYTYGRHRMCLQLHVLESVVSMYTQNIAIDYEQR